MDNNGNDNSDRNLGAFTAYYDNVDDVYKDFPNTIWSENEYKNWYFSPSPKEREIIIYISGLHIIASDETSYDKYLHDNIHNLYFI